MRKYLNPAIATLLISCMLTFFGYCFYIIGFFGNYYIKQDFDSGGFNTWIWHNIDIIYSFHDPIDSASTSFRNKRHKQAEELIKHFKEVTQ